MTGLPSFILDMGVFVKRQALGTRSGHSTVRAKSSRLWAIIFGILAVVVFFRYDKTVLNFIRHSSEQVSSSPTVEGKSGHGTTEKVHEERNVPQGTPSTDKSISTKIKIVEEKDDTPLDKIADAEVTFVEESTGTESESEKQVKSSTNNGEKESDRVDKPDEESSSSTEESTANNQDNRMASLLWNESLAHEFVAKCNPSHFVIDPPDIADSDALLQVFTSDSERKVERDNIKRPYASVTVDNVPCTKNANTACCKNTFWFRFGSTDVHVFDQVIRQDYLKLLYPFSKGRIAEEIEYILDAGANCGLSTYILKALFPGATIVSLEPDPENFEILSKNTKSLEKVHVINAGLWNETGKLKLTGNHGDWGRVFKKVPDSDQEGMLAYSVQDLLKKFDIPRFDLIKMDIEGSESVVLSSFSDIAWLQDTKILFMEIHDFFAKYFSLSEENHDVTNIVQEAASKNPNLLKFLDNEHTLYIQQSTLEKTLGKTLDKHM